MRSDRRQSRPWAPATPRSSSLSGMGSSESQSSTSQLKTKERPLRSRGAPQTPSENPQPNPHAPLRVGNSAFYLLWPQAAWGGLRGIRAMHGQPQNCPEGVAERLRAVTEHSSPRADEPKMKEESHGGSCQLNAMKPSSTLTGGPQAASSLALGGHLSARLSGEWGQFLLHARMHVPSYESMKWKTILSVLSQEGQDQKEGPGGVLGGALLWQSVDTGHLSTGATQPLPFSSVLPTCMAKHRTTAGTFQNAQRQHLTDLAPGTGWHTALKQPELNTLVSAFPHIPLNAWEKTGPQKRFCCIE